ncbi:domain found in IF2B/IF5-domain-containing protein [Endogone sp. FLAS-F59071]|nr:domain found in IF2B/IF5-domain-containing protein [Endogone sp. FLAS-F59071]|eukprot:RUS21050.1 domain found in IF2B/IF5-domain-containing protein [Endogone sp. FLAS-F59071]
MSDVEKDQIESHPGEEEFDSSLKKKKKKSKKQVDLDDEVKEDEPRDPQEDDAQGDEEDVEQMFAELKKKKKKKFKSTEEEKPEGEEQAEGEDDINLGELTKKKKKKKNMAEFEAELAGDDDAPRDVDDIFGADADDGDDKENKVDEDAWLKSDRDYTYEELLGRVFKILRQNNPELAGEKKRYTIVPPQIVRDGNKKIVFANISDICKRMHRSPEHVIQFLFAELGTSGSVDGSQRLVIKGRFQQKQIENVLRRYIVEYVTCKTCKSPDTILTKDQRLYFVQCESCGSTRSVSAIKIGFKAQTEKRAAQRRAQAT